MSDHTCSPQCFIDHADDIRRFVKVKVANHKRTDSATKFIGCLPTMSTKAALALLHQSGGVCAICKTQSILHHWPHMSMRQFSFDRLDDDDSHHVDNVQVTCLGCNFEKARATYQPNAEYLAEYNERVADFMEYTRNPRCPKFVYTSQTAHMKAYISWLHDQVYGDRKRNNWGFIKRSQPPSPVPTGFYRPICA